MMNSELMLIVMCSAFIIAATATVNLVNDTFCFSAAVGEC